MQYHFQHQHVKIGYTYSILLPTDITDFDSYSVTVTTTLQALVASRYNIRKALSAKTLAPT